MSECHIAYWELYPTIDHRCPIARGGEDADTNWVTTSMLRNSAKANWTMEELGWKIFPEGDHLEWDGLTKIFLQYVEPHPEILADRDAKIWCAAARKAAEQFTS
jgi:hypothetical protein